MRHDVWVWEPALTLSGAATVSGISRWRCERREKMPFSAVRLGQIRRATDLPEFGFPGLGNWFGSERGGGG